MIPDEPPKAHHADSATTAPLTRQMLQACKRARFRRKITDSTGVSMTGGQLLTKALVLRRLLLREVLSDDERRVGVLLPPTNGGVVVNASLALAGRVAVNLNYSASAEVINACIEAAGLRHVLTSEKVLSKLGIELGCEPVLLEAFRDKVTTSDKLSAAWQAYATPVATLERQLGLAGVGLEDPITIIFTSGSTGRPKGVVLTHRNLIANIRGFETAVQLDARDVILGILPFFHAFGYTVTLWAPLILELGGAYHFNPLDAKQVGKLCKRAGATILLSTPTFLRSYIKRVPPEDFDSLDVVVVGAEKMPIPLADAFEKRFGLRPVEGYGATELAPVASVNIPPTRSLGTRADLREGSIGLPLPGVEARVVDPETGQLLPADTEGMLEVRGPNLMQGYLDDPERTTEVVRDGWYVTGDMARIDPDGFIFITGRQSRFSKIGGEMVPHLRVEEEIQSFLAGEDEERQLAVVTGVPDEKKGERLVVVHLPIDKAPREVCDALKAAGLPNLWIPSPDSFTEVDELPLLGSGKLDLKGLAAVAQQRFANAG
ncbi:AMP-binding protein [Botrimarina sp.]|uniref:AMP-binding protein n=1 Tax=Botrimarina sp. TaxID=2795802 RepID=UPI0032EEF1C6